MIGFACWGKKQMLSIPDLSSIDLRSPPQLPLPKAICTAVQIRHCTILEMGGRHHSDLKLYSVPCAHLHAATFYLLPWTEFLPRAPGNALSPNTPVSCIADILSLSQPKIHTASASGFCIHGTHLQFWFLRLWKAITLPRIMTGTLNESPKSVN